MEYILFKNIKFDLKILFYISTVFLLFGENLVAEPYANNDSEFYPKNADAFLREGISIQENTDSGLLVKVLEFSSDDYYLWDSEASLIAGENGERRHVRVRIEENQLNKVQDKLKTVHANGNSLSPKAEIQRAHVEIHLDESKSIRLFPYAEDKESLIAAFERIFLGHTVGITKQGVVFIIGADSITYGYLDYYIIKPSEFVFQKLTFSEVFEENGFDTILITYPSGVKQKMYFFKDEITTI